MRYALLAIVLVLVACAPATPIRRTALVPTATAPSRIGRVLQKGEVTLSGVYSARSGPIESEALIAQVGDAGLLIPDVQLGLAAYTAVSRHVEVGAQGYFASRHWSSPNVVGVLPFARASRANVVMGGLGMRGSGHLGDSPISLGVSLELNVARIYQAVYVCVDCTPDFAPATPTYELDREENELFFFPSGSLQLGVDLGKMVYLGTFFGLQRNLVNNGFDADASNVGASTLEGYALFVPGIVGELRYGAALASVSLSMPLESVASVQMGALFTTQLGVVF